MLDNLFWVIYIFSWILLFIHYSYEYFLFWKTHFGLLFFSFISVIYLSDILQIYNSYVA